MRFIPTRIHGVLDYLMGALLIAAPWIFDFNRGGAETWVPVILGAGVIIYSLVTDYELSATKQLSMGTHLMLDIIGGIFLAASPWIFGFADYVYLPHLILGLAEIGSAIFTKRVPDYKTHNTHRTTDTNKGTYADRKSNTATPGSRPPMGSNAETRTRREGERTNREH